jgi:hypothetical protein
MFRSIASRALLGVFAVLVAVLSSRAADTAAPNTLTADEIADGWLLLFDGESMYGWKPSSKADWKVADGVISVSSGEKGLLCTTCQWANYVFKVDFRAPKTTNSGVFLRTPTEPKDPKSDCYELNIAAPEVSPFFTGSFVGREKSSVKEFDESWHTFEVTADKARLVVKLDGREVLTYTDPNPVTKGHIGLQFNSGKVEFKNVKLKPLGLSNIFNGKDLEGWKVVEAPDRQKSRFSVTDAGEINVKNGPGALESEGRYGDFALQFDVLSNGKHLNSGIFFRSIPGQYNNGYECQIRHQWEGDDRNRPVDFGTGGIYRRQPARRVNAEDHKWATITLVAQSNHVAVWVNGLQVSDWTDTRDPHENPRNGLRTEPGTLQIQGHDPTTDLSFRKLRVGNL